MHDRYTNPLCTRYAWRTLQHIYSDDNKFSTWRRLWVALAESEQELGLPITDAQLEQLRAHITDIDYAYAAEREHEVRHDVMAHVLTYGACCPDAKPILHLGATSCYVGDNTDIILMREALEQSRSLIHHGEACSRIAGHHPLIFGSEGNAGNLADDIAQIQRRPRVDAGSVGTTRMN